MSHHPCRLLPGWLLLAAVTLAGAQEPVSGPPSLTVEAAVQVALESHPLLVAAAHQVSAAQSGLRAAGALILFLAHRTPPPHRSRTLLGPVAVPLRGDALLCAFQAWPMLLPSPGPVPTSAQAPAFRRWRTPPTTLPGRFVLLC